MVDVRLIRKHSQHSFQHCTRLPIASLLICICGALMGVQSVQVITGNPSSFAAIHSTHRYAIAIDDKGILTPSQLDFPVGTIQQPMTDGSGRKFTCYIPPKQQQASTSQVSNTASAMPPPVARSPFELLDRLSGLCFDRLEGQWRYEMCYKKRARQFRPATAETKGEDFSCGVYREEDTQSEEEEIKEDSASPGETPWKYVSHIMTGGDPCLLTGAPRTTEVRFMCVKDIKETMITSVREFPSCNYIFTVATPLLCKHPLLKPPDDMVHTIKCIPADHTVGGLGGGRDAPSNEVQPDGGNAGFKQEQTQSFQESTSEDPEDTVSNHSTEL